MTNLITKPESENSIYRIHQQIEALGFRCSPVQTLAFSHYLTFTIKTTDGDIAISTTKIPGKLAFTKPHTPIIFVDSDKIVGYFQARLDLITKPFPLQHHHYPPQKTRQTIITFSEEKFYRLEKKLYPSVTTILAHTMPEAKRKSLEFWRRKVGEEQAEQIKEEAIARGQKIHQLLENYAHGQETQCPPELTPFYRQALATVKSFKRIFCTEEFLYHPQLQYAGTTDLIADVEDIPTIIDYKTSSKPKKPSYMEDAKIQGAAYALACQACKQIYIPQVLILVIHPHGTQEFWVKEEQREEYVEKWLQRLESYLAQPVPISG